jgi:hypothetical protein
MPPLLRGLGWTGHPMQILPTTHEFKSRVYFTGLALSLIWTRNIPVTMCPKLPFESVYNARTLSQSVKIFFTIRPLRIVGFSKILYTGRLAFLIIQ